MKCPYCSSDDIKVIDSRPVEENNAIRRRRQCNICGKRFTSYERIETIPFMVIKKDNTREPYSRTKLEDGVIRACHKRPVSPKDVSALVDSVESAIFGGYDKEVSTTAIGGLVMQRLLDLDEVAYVRFASVYREFTDVNGFIREVENLYRTKNSGEEESEG